ncbi:MAG: hypothetical protein AAGB31_15575 [Bdellovibrio sp.]
MKQLLSLAAVSVMVGQASFANTQAIILADSRSGIRQFDKVYTPAVQGDLEAIYELNDIKISGQGREALYLEVPTQFKNQVLESLSLTHRQDPGEERECHSTVQNDCRPAYVSMEVFDLGKQSLQWRFWGGTGSGPYNSKFSEIRSSEGETDNLYEWHRKGHYSVETQKDFSKSSVYPGLIRLRSVGPDEARIQQVVLRISPPLLSKLNDYIFSSGLSFGDYITAEGRSYPGSPNYGYYGDALVLDSYNYPAHQKIPSHWSKERGALRVPLKPGTRLVSVDVACGDMKPVPRGANPENYRGNATLSVRVLKNGKKHQDLFKRRNVGSNGVMRATLPSLSYVAGDNEEVEIRSERGRLYIMGIRFGEF